MGDVVDLHGPRVPDDTRPELIADLARYAEGLLTEQFVRRKYRFDETTWERLGDDDALVEAIETEKVRRIRDGSTKREKAQALVTEAPNVLSGIMLDAGASPRHRVDAAKTLDAFAANGPEGAATAAERFVIQINIGNDTERYSKSLSVNPDDIDPYNNKSSDTDNTEQTPQELLLAAFVKNKTTENGGDNSH